MSDMKTSRHKSTKKTEHGNTVSYVVGFVLSLIFTIIPYYLVVDKVLTGNTLLFTILGIAIVQMFIQIFFFLHLGRGPKPLYNVVFFFATAGVIVLVVGASIFIMQNLYQNMSPKDVTTRLAQEENIAQIGGEETGACNEVKASHIVVIKDSKPSPSRIYAQRCDILTFVNEDAQKREVSFGKHPDHSSYGGVEEVMLSKGHPETITLNQTGEFMFHDHLDPGMAGRFTVEP